MLREHAGARPRPAPGARPSPAERGARQTRKLNQPPGALCAHAASTRWGPPADVPHSATAIIPWLFHLTAHTREQPKLRKHPKCICANLTGKAGTILVYAHWTATVGWLLLPLDLAVGGRKARAPPDSRVWHLQS